MSNDAISHPAIPADQGVVADATGSQSAPRGRLFRKYVLFFVGLVGVALLVNGGVDFWFGYQENKEALVRVQQEKADAAAQHIQEFVEEIPAADRLDDACAMVGDTAGAAPVRLCPSPAPGARDHRDLRARS
jgi:hypothetical protein